MCPVSKLTSRSRGCGKVGVPRSMRDFQAGWESRFWDFSSPRLFHNPWRRRFVLQQLSFRAIAAQALRSVSEGERSIQMLVHPHRAARQGRSPTHRFDLQAEVLKAHRVISIHRPLKLHTKNEVEVLTSAWQKGCSPLRRAHLKMTVELGDIVLPQKPVRLLQRRDAVQAQLLGQTPLPGPEVALAAAPRLRRIGRDHLDS